MSPTGGLGTFSPGSYIDERGVGGHGLKIFWKDNFLKRFEIPLGDAFAGFLSLSLTCTRFFWVHFPNSDVVPLIEDLNKKYHKTKNLT